MTTSEQQVGIGNNFTTAANRAEQKVTWRQWYLAAALTLLYIYAQIDGSAIIILVEPIKRDFGLTDTQMSVPLAFSFAIPYAILGVVAGYLVDRMSRRKVMGVGIWLWSAMTMSCGVAQTYAQFFFARCAVGIGEASITPASYSLIRDAFPP